MESKGESSHTQSNQQSPTQIVCIYAKRDESFYRELQTYLILWQRQEHIAWLEINPGDDVRETIEAYLQQAHLVLLLLSPSFFALDSCYTAMKAALQEQAKRRVPVCPC